MGKFEINKSFVVLANSQKNQYNDGRCVAGIELNEEDWTPTQWIRPVGDRDRGEVWPIERILEDNRDPQVLDVVKMGVIEHRPEGPQSENWLLDSRVQWEFQGRLGIEKLQGMVSSERLWMTDNSEMNFGKNDKVADDDSRVIQDSLRLIKVDKVSCKETSSFYDGEIKKKRRAEFHHQGVKYNLSITDPRIIAEFSRSHLKTLEKKNCYLTVSLGEEFKGYRYKIVAAIIEV